jgi:protein tyrosine phosphatase type 4A
MSINIIPLTFIEYKTKSFYISHSPTDDNIQLFVESLKKNHIRHVIRLCEKTYDYRIIENENINFYELEIPDGTIPSKKIIEQWNSINKKIGDNEKILVHCIAGLGRAPLMVTISLINEYMEPIDAIKLIRKNRPGSFNSKQLEFLVDYKPNLIKKKFNWFKYLICNM